MKYRGLGPLQKCILKQFTTPRIGPFCRQILYIDVQEEYWGEPIIRANTEEEKRELNRRRSAIAQALRGLKDRGLVGNYFGIPYLTKKGEEEEKNIK